MTITLDLTEAEIVEAIRKYINDHPALADRLPENIVISFVGRCGTSSGPLDGFSARLEIP